MAAPVLRHAFDPCQPFTRAEARSAGVSMSELAGPRFQRIFYNLYVSQAVTLSPLVRARAALKVSPHGSHASHFTAGEIWDGCVPEQPHTHVASPRAQSRCQRSDGRDDGRN